MLTLTGLKKSFGAKKAVDIPAFIINDGDFLGLVGNNGAGKTTLFRLIVDLLMPDDGEILINDINPAKSEQWKHFTGTFLEDGFLIDFLTPEEYFSFVGKINELTNEQMDKAMQMLMPLMGEEILNQRKLIRDFSAGNKQKIGIVAALLHHPSLVILDEPFNFLDPSSQITLKNTLINYNKDTGATILISSHNLQHVTDICTRIALMEEGNILKDLANLRGNAKKELEDYFLLRP